ncbi:conserved hypothetical protein [Hyphomicrobiales bacterium]|nr:conserved hypothetical protein [Hyphomicrobiales bacterium]CAH1699099.1 conserved hypothetical protein [Hyphomicrobiales bacterium]CAI0342888.1 conserved hypothetical protein [Hyphomicrobiales bacterium]
MRVLLARGNNGGMIRISIAAGAVAILVAGCVSSSPRPVPGASAGPGKRIVRDSAQLVLPDGTRVSPDASGGFELPNGDYVKRDPSGALVLPTGARCLPDQGGYLCP